MLVRQVQEIEVGKGYVWKEKVIEGSYRENILLQHHPDPEAKTTKEYNLTVRFRGGLLEVDKAIPLGVFGGKPELERDEPNHISLRLSGDGITEYFKDNGYNTFYNKRSREEVRFVWREG